jgi:hypothetical protein
VENFFLSEKGSSISRNFLTEKTTITNPTEITTTIKTETITPILLVLEDLESDAH